MDIAALLRTMGGLGVVLGMLAAALWLVRRYDIALPGRVGVKLGRRVELVERIQIDGKRSIILVRRDDREHLFVLHPDRATILETRILRADEEAQAIADHAQSEDQHGPVLCSSLEEAWFNA